MPTTGTEQPGIRLDLEFACPDDSELRGEPVARAERGSRPAGSLDGE